MEQGLVSDQTHRLNLLPARVAVGFLCSASATDAGGSAPNRSQRSLGTAFAISRSHLITAYHNLTTGKSRLLRKDLRVGFLSGRKFDVMFEHGDEQLDVAVVRLTRGILPVDLERIRLTDRIPEIGSNWFALGFPQNRSTSRMIAIGGKVRLVDLPGPCASYQLHCDEGAAGTKLRGFSGAPMFVQDDQSWDPTGLLIKGLPSETHAELVDGGTVFATSVPTEQFTLPAPAHDDEVQRIFERYRRFKSRPDYAETFDDDVRKSFEREILMMSYTRHEEQEMGRTDYLRYVRRKRRELSGQPARRNSPVDQQRAASIPGEVSGDG